MNAKREARRKRDREDFVRATQARVPAKLREEAGRHAGFTYREHLENKLESACTRYRDLDPSDDRAKTLRGIIRGLAMALLLYEDSYSIDDKAKLIKLERSFMQ